MQAGSSIMPGKVNPVIPEVVNQMAFEVIGNDVTVTLAAEAGQLQLNAFEPIIAHSLFKSIDAPAQRLPDPRRALRERDHGEPRAAAARRRELDGIVTALTPYSATRTRRRSRRKRWPRGAAWRSSCSKRNCCRRQGWTHIAARRADEAAADPRIAE